MTRQAVLSFGSIEGITFLLIDNGSFQMTQKEVEDLHALKNTLFVENSFNLGVGPAWNLGMMFAFYSLKVDRVIICNNDILARPDTVPNLLNFAIKNDAGFVTAYNIAPLCKTAKEFPGFIVPDPEVTESHPDFSFFMVSRHFAETLCKSESNLEPLRGFFDPNFAPAYFEDNDYHRRCTLNNLKCLKTHSAPYYHIQSQTKKSSLNTAAMVKETYVKNFYYYATKWGGDRGNETFEFPFDKPYDAFKELGYNIT